MQKRVQCGPSSSCCAPCCCPPHFLFFVEIGRQPGAELTQLTGYEVATRLSYLLWGTMPDADLMTAAAAGKLDEATGVEEQVVRMLEDPRTLDAIQDFYSQWMDLVLIEELTVPDGFDDQLRKSARWELEHLISHWFSSGSGAVPELFTTRQAFVDPTLARDERCVSHVEKGALNVAKISRRTLLRGGACIAVSLPWLEALAPARAAAQTGTGRPSRFVVVFHGNGVHVPTWYPEGTGREFQLKRSLAPLEAFKDRMLITSGLSNDSAKTQSGNSHTKMSHLLTGAPHIDGQFSQGGGGGFSTGISFDQALANEVGKDTCIRSLLCGPFADEGSVGVTPRARMSYAGNNQPLTPEHRPQAIFDRIVSHTGTGSEGAEELEQVRAQRRSVLDFVREDMVRLEARLSTGDRARLDQYLTHLRALEQDLASATGVAGCAPPADPSNIANVSDRAATPQLTQQMFALMAVALECDLTRVATFQWHGSQSNINYDKFLSGVSADSHHNISHKGQVEDMAEDLRVAFWTARDIA